MRTEVEGLARALEAFLTEEVEVAKNSHQVHRKEGPPIWSDEIWRESDPDGFERAQNARSALAAYRACEAVTVEGLDLDALEKVAREATPGPWQLQDGCSWRRVGTRESDGNVLCPTTHHRDHHPDLCAGRGEDVYANLRHITTFDPPTVLRLLAALRAQAERVRVLEGERDEARGVVRETLWMARRYADGRQTYAVGMFNDAAKLAVAGGYAIGEPDGTIFARDGSALEYRSAEARAEAAERRAGELEGALRPFADAARAAMTSGYPCWNFCWAEDYAAAAALLPATQAENPQEHDDE